MKEYLSECCCFLHHKETGGYRSIPFSWLEWGEWETRFRVFEVSEANYDVSS